MREYEEFVDKKFGKLTVTKYVGKSQFNSPLFECKCECGNTTYATSTQLRNKQKRSCGCLKKECHYKYKQQIADLEAKLAEKDPDTLSFFIEELEQLKEEIANVIEKRNDNRFLWAGYIDEIPRDDVNELIDSKIKELKEKTSDNQRKIRRID